MKKKILLLILVLVSISTNALSQNIIHGKISGDVQSGISVELYKTSCGSDVLVDTFTTNSEGYYAFGCLDDGDYRVAPKNASYLFTPESANIQIPQTVIQPYDFIATEISLPTYTISGTIINEVTEGITVILSGDSFATTTTDADGNYSFTGLINGNYTITPSLGGYVFSPTNQSVEISGFDTTVDVLVGSVAETKNIYLNNNGTGSGTGTEADPYGSFSEINWTDISNWIAAGCSVYINLATGQEWLEQLTIKTSGTATAPITIQPYGSVNNPIINGSNVITEWSNVGGPLYATTGITTFPYYVLEDGIKLTECHTLVDCAAISGGWYYDIINDTVYITTIGDDSPSEHTIEFCTRDGIFINGNDYVTVSGINIVKARRGIDATWTEDGRLVEDFEDASEWIASGTGCSLSNNTVDYISGEQAITINATDMTVFNGMTKEVNLDLSNAETITLMMNTGAEGTTFYTDIRFGFNSSFSVCMRSYAYLEKITHDSIGGWGKVTLSLDDFSSVGGGSFNDPVTHLSIRIYYSADPTGRSVTFDELRILDKKPPAVVLMSFDDAYLSDVDTVMPILSNNGQVATSFVAQSMVGAGGKMDEADLATLYDAGWDISNHSMTHLPLAGQPREIQESEINDAYEWLVGLGYDKSAKFYAYANSSLDSNTIDIVKENHVFARTGGNAAYSTHITGLNDDRFMTPSKQPTSTASAISLIDKTIARGSLLQLYDHGISDDTTINTTEFTAISNYLKSKEDAGLLKVMTYSGYWEFITLFGLQLIGNTISGCSEGIHMNSTVNSTSTNDNILFNNINDFTDEGIAP